MLHHVICVHRLFMKMMIYLFYLLVDIYTLITILFRIYKWILVIAFLIKIV